MDGRKRTHSRGTDNEEISLITVGHYFSHKVTYFAEGEMPFYDISDSEGSSSDEWRNQTIVFSETGKDVWEDALVVTLQVEDNIVKRVLVDDLSSVNILFRDAAQEMGITLTDITKSAVTITDFGGDQIQTSCHVTLWSHTKGNSMMTDFHIVDASSAYKAIVGRPWIHNMMSFPSTYHQCMKFPSP